MKKEDLLNLINDDDLGLLDIKSKNSSTATAEDRLVSSFFEINNFILEHGKEPQAGGDLQEHQLASRLKSIREDKEKIKTLVNFDEYNLLGTEPKEIRSMKDIFEDDDLGILDSTDESLYDLRNVSAYRERNAAEYIAHRKPCRDFEKYEHLFQKCQADLASGKRKLLPFESRQQLKEKSFYVLNGILLYVDEIGKTYLDKYRNIDGRQRCIFENGTESEMLYRSLSRRLYENGHVVSENLDSLDLIKNFNSIDESDNKTGFIYIVRSLSENPKIKSLENLYKIGFSTIPVEDRIKNASEEPTYLMAPVQIITSFECYNFNPQKLELLLHNFFGAACLNVDVFDSDNKRYTPREWFVAPLEIIEKAIHLIIDGGIINYQYDLASQQITLK